MPDRAIEEAHLLQARCHVAAAATRIAKQCLLIGRLRARGLSTAQAEACLRTLQDSFSIMRAHKAVIESVLEQIPRDRPALRTKARTGRRLSL